MTRSREEVRKIVENLGYIFIDDYYSDNNHRNIIIQDMDGYKYDVYLTHLMNNHIPYFVSPSNPFTLSHNIPLWLKLKNKSIILLEKSEYKRTHDKLLFKCLVENCQEVFDMSWNDVYWGHGCPFCAGKRVGKYNNLAYHNPNLIKEWDYDRNNGKPEEYTYGSNKKVYWVCSKCGHDWKTSINDRTSGRGCSKCADLQKESTIANQLKKYFKENYNAITEYRIFKNPDTGYWLPYDIYVPHGENPDLNGFYIEVHWNQHYEIIKRWHKTREDFNYQQWKDKIKKKFAKKNGIYIEIDLRKIKTTEKAIKYIEIYLEKYG